MLADYQSKPVQGKLFYVYDHRNTIMGISPEDFDCYKRMYIEVLKHYELYDDEEDLFDIWIHRSVLEIVDSTVTSTTRCVLIYSYMCNQFEFKRRYWLRMFFGTVFAYELMYV